MATIGTIMVTQSREDQSYVVDCIVLLGESELQVPLHIIARQAPELNEILKALTGFLKTTALKTMEAAVAGEQPS